MDLQFTNRFILVLRTTIDHVYTPGYVDDKGLEVSAELQGVAEILLAGSMYQFSLMADWMRLSIWISCSGESID